MLVCAMNLLFAESGPAEAVLLMAVKGFGWVMVVVSSGDGVVGLVGLNFFLRGLLSSSSSLVGVGEQVFVRGEEVRGRLIVLGLAGARFLVVVGVEVAVGETCVSELEVESRKHEAETMDVSSLYCAVDTTHRRLNEKSDKPYWT